MNIPPSLIRIGFQRSTGRIMHLWLPLFILWPLLLLLGLVAFVCTVCLDVILFATGVRYHRYTRLLWESVNAVHATRGLSVAIDADTPIDFKLV